MSHVSTEYQGLETLIQIQLQPLNWLVKLNIKMLILSIAICFSISLFLQSVRQALISFFCLPYGRYQKGGQLSYILYADLAVFA
jgi:hypothetical protein